MRYFDHNATSPLCAEARDAWLSAVDRYLGNPSSPHRLGSRASVALEEARAECAYWLGCAAHEIVWTSGATESLNAALHHCARTTMGEVWISAIEHPATWRAAEHWLGTRRRILPVTCSGVIDLQWLEERLKSGDRPELVVIMAANNETGVLQPWPEALSLCREQRIPLLCDAAQWIGKRPAAGLGDCMYVAGCAHKFGGPTGVGFLKVSGEFQPLFMGGGQEEGRRAGTESLPQVLAMMAAWRRREEQLARGEEQERQSWRTEFVRVITSIPGLDVLGDGAATLWNTVMVTMPEIEERRRWVVLLDRAGFAVSTGSACASGKEAPSHVLSSMAIPPALASRALRVSSGWDTIREDWQILAETLTRLATEMAGATRPGSKIKGQGCSTE